MVTLTQEQKVGIEKFITNLIEKTIISTYRIDNFSNHAPTNEQLEGVKQNCLELIHMFYKPGTIREINCYFSYEDRRVIITAQIDFNKIEQELSKDSNEMIKMLKMLQNATPSTPYLQ
jgi:hypothetical protein